MKNRVCTICFYLFSLHCINAQVISYKMPRDTSNFLGHVKKAFLFEYRINLSDTSKLDNSLSAGLPPSYSYHFSKDKLMTHMLSYQGDSVFTVTHFLYDQYNNLIYKVRGRPNNNYEIDEHQIGTGVNTPEGNLEFKMTYTYFDEHNLIVKTDGAEITRYHYDMENLTMLVATDMHRPSTRYVFDDRGRIVETEFYSYEKGSLKMRKEKKIYQGDLLIQERRDVDNMINTTYFDYDNNGKKITEKTIRTDSIHNRTTHYRYTYDDTIETEVYNHEGRLILTTVETSENNEVRKIFDNKGDEFLLYSQIIECKDEVGNVIKRYKIDAQKKSAIVAEYHFTYY